MVEKQIFIKGTVMSFFKHTVLFFVVQKCSGFFIFCFPPATLPPPAFRWLIYEEPGFQGVPLMLEPGEYPNLAFWEKKEAYIRSMRPLKMVKYCYYFQVT